MVRRREVERIEAAFDCAKFVVIVRIECGEGGAGAAAGGECGGDGRGEARGAGGEGD